MHLFVFLSDYKSNLVKKKVKDHYFKNCILKPIKLIHLRPGITVGNMSRIVLRPVFMECCILQLSQDVSRHSQSKVKHLH